MNNMPLKLRKELSKDSYYSKCVRYKDGNCNGRVTWEHCWEYSGKQIQEKWAIIPLCWFHHLGIGLNKKINRWFSINRMTEEDMKKYPRINWIREKIILNGLFKK
jgi:hypothetical protein